MRVALAPRPLLAALFAPIAILAACSHGASGGGGAFVAVNPDSASVAPGESQQFTAGVVSGEMSGDFTWSIAEGSSAGSLSTESSAGSSIHDVAVFTAPKTPGTYHVVATTANGLKGQSTVTVK